jgi:hypothetical protein
MDAITSTAFCERQVLRTLAIQTKLYLRCLNKLAALRRFLFSFLPVIHGNIDPLSRGRNLL